MPNFNFEIVALIIEYILCYSLNEAHLLDIKVQFMHRFQDDLAAKCATKGLRAFKSFSRDFLLRSVLKAS